MNQGVEDEEVLQRTPERWVEAFCYMLGDGSDKKVNFTTFPSDADDLVHVGPIQFASLCAHHLLPFFGHAHIGYIPQGRIAGLSKLARVVQVTSFGLWTQEDLTQTIAKTIEACLMSGGAREPRGVAVVMKAEHTCMSVRGVKAIGAKTTTSCMRGVFADHDRLARAEFLEMIKND
jgi:GTP cyclohydrolase IA